VRKARERLQPARKVHPFADRTPTRFSPPPMSARAFSQLAPGSNEPESAGSDLDSIRVASLPRARKATPALSPDATQELPAHAADKAETDGRPMRSPSRPPSTSRPASGSRLALATHWADWEPRSKCLRCWAAREALRSGRPGSWRSPASWQPASAEPGCYPSAQARPGPVSARCNSMI
jgi:hypothetical protein